MATLTIRDLPCNQALDRQAMRTLRGGGAPWVFGWITPYAPRTTSFAPVVNNFFQNNNYIGQLVDQSQSITINNAGSGSTVTAVLIGSQGIAAA